MRTNLRENLYSILVNKIHFLLISFSSIISAQTSTSISDIKKQFDQAIVYVNTDNAEKAIPLLHKINNDSKSVDYKLGITRVGHILAIIYFNSSDYKKVITLDDEFLKIGKEIKDYEKLSHIHRLKGCAYSELGFLKKGYEERIQALRYAKKMNVGNKKQYAISLIYSNLADYYIKKSGPKDSVFVNLNKNIEEAKKIDEVDDFYQSIKYSLIAYSYMIFGNEYSKLDKPKVAENYFLKSLEIHNTKSIPLVERIILLSQLGIFYNSQNEYEKAVKYAELGVSTERKASFPQTRRDLFEVLSKSYLELLKTEESKKYLNLFTALNDSISNVEKKAVETTLSSAISKQEKTYLDITNKRTLIFTLFSFALIVFGICFFFYYKKKKQKQIRKIETIIEQLKANQNNSLDVLLVESEISKTEDKEEKNLMSVEAEKKLLEKLHHFEEKKLYLDRKVSLSYVATEIESNTKYLSYIIKNHKGKDFNKYINDLRINYIVQKINDDPIYRQYKINFLAEETGFSSHSKFATVFKNTIGVSPSEFINYLERNKKQ